MKSVSISLSNKKTRLFLDIKEIEPDIPKEVIDEKPVKQKFAKFNYKDALNLEKLLTEEEIMVRDQFHDYCQDKLMPRILMANRDEGMYIYPR